MKYVSPYVKIKDQGNVGFCVGNAFAVMMEIFEMNKQQNEDVPQLSALFLQAECKANDSYSGSQGTYVSSACSVLKNKGICKEENYPYFITSDIQNLKFPSRNQKLYDEAKQCQIKDYTNTKDVQKIKDHILKYGAAPMQNYFHQEKYYKNVLVDIGKKSTGIHQTCLIGFDDDFIYQGFKGAFLRLNSDNTKLQYGYGLEIIPYAHFYTKWFINATLCTPTSHTDYLQWNYSGVGIELPHDKVKLVIGSNNAIINGGLKVFDTAPVLKSNTTLVPIQLCREAFRKVDVDWDYSKTAIVTDYSGTFYFKIGRKEVLNSFGDVVYKCSVPPQLINNRTMIPIRAFSEVLGAEVKYDKYTKEIDIVR